MPDLIEDLRAIAPAPDEAFVARLEQRVEAGFPKPGRRPRRASLFKPALALAVTIAFVGLVSIPIFAGGGGDDDGTSSGGGSVAAQPAPETSDGASSSSSAARAPAPAADAVA